MKAKETIPIKEQEAVFNYIPGESIDKAQIYTTIPWMMKYLWSMCEQYPDQYKVVKDDQYSLTVELPFSLIKPRKPRIMTEEQRIKCVNALKGARTKKETMSMLGELADE